jgi:type IV secretory pathway TrbL component
MKGLISVGVAALFWAIWRCRNDVIFNELKTNSIMQVIFRGAYWLRFWSQFQHDEQAKETSLC